MGKYIHLLTIRYAEQFKNVRMLTEKRKFQNQDYAKFKKLYSQYVLMSTMLLGKHDEAEEVYDLESLFQFQGKYYKIIPNKGNNCNDCSFKIAGGECKAKRLRDATTGFCTNKNFVEETDLLIK